MAWPQMKSSEAISAPHPTPPPPFTPKKFTHEIGDQHCLEFNLGLILFSHI